MGWQAFIDDDIMKHLWERSRESTVGPFFAAKFVISHLRYMHKSGPRQLDGDGELDWDGFEDEANACLMFLETCIDEAYGLDPFRKPKMTEAEWEEGRERAQWKRVRRLVLDRDGEVCAVDGCVVTEDLHVHHIVPRADGGTHEMDNLITLCPEHHC
ncbi:MAG TPA: HNH endonuclease, partial [Phycisphaerae bacterium]|nr:HNH endonuclease [Phycisphaerae bacterium]